MSVHDSTLSPNRISAEIKDIIEESLPYSYSAAIIRRGKTLFQSGNVVTISRADAEYGEVFTASVYGSRGDLYDTELFIDDDGGMISSDCSCPYEYNCKHGAALAYALLNAEEPTAPNVEEPLSPEAWLDQFRASLEPALPQSASGQWHLFYLVKCINGVLTLSIVQRYQKLTGDWGRIESLPPGQVAVNHALGAADHEVLGLLQGLRVRPLYQDNKMLEHSYDAQGARGRQILEWAVRSGRALEMETLQRWFWGEPRALELDWVDAGKGERLQLHLDPKPDDNWELFDQLAPPLYRIGNTVGPVETRLDAHQLALIRTMPAVSSQQKIDVSLHAKHHCNLQCSEPLPEVESVDEGVPEMVFTGLRFPAKGILPALRFQVHYGELCFRPGFDEANRNSLGAVKPTLVQTETGYVWLSRNWEKEAAWMRQLRAHSLAPYRENENTEEVFVPAEVQPQRHIQCWNRALPALQQMIDSGEWLLEIDDSYQQQHSVAQLQGDASDAGHGWFDLKLNFNLGGTSLDTESVLTQWLEADAPDNLFIQGQDEYWQSVDMRPLKPVLGFVMELFGDNGFSSKLRLPSFKAGELDELEDINFGKAPALKKLRAELKNFKGVKTVAPARSLHAELREYQQRGLSWLMFLHRYGFGGVLADDMGLGKTLQTLAFLQRLKAGRKLTRGALVVAPTSLIWNWQREAEKFTPNLKTQVLHGAERAECFEDLSEYDLIITTYGLIRRDFEIHESQEYDVAVLDEAQNIKNARAKTTRLVKQLPARMRLCLTGTPLENHLGELWSIADYFLPGLLGSIDQFNRQFRSPIERDGDSNQARTLSQRIAPFMLRRTKGEVLKELPSKVEMLQIVNLEGKQHALYESIRVSMEKRVRDLIKAKGLAKSRIEFLDALLKLRQSCIDPRLVKLKKAASIKQSAKMMWLVDNVPELVEDGRKILLFSQFTTMLDLIENELSACGIPSVKLTGRTRKREAVIERFQNGNTPVFLISLKAGGSGLNLTAADTVIHVDPWWNPAVENQATDRAHRIGQEKTVFVYKLVAAGTVEEKIQEMQASKQALADNLFDESKKVGLPASSEELLDLFQ